ncbi:MAG: ABC transporter ATP-binding protein/permease [Bacilli bacterium]|nr:ABC transporter ATP-binding protein/permease [Bacilli bacterium]
MIKLENVSKTYHSKDKIPCTALSNINLELPNKGMIFLLGKSGSGKSTLLHILGGLDKFDNGSIWIDDKSLNNFSEKELDAYRNTYVGFIFQDFHLLENYNVYENIKMVQELQNKKTTNEEIDPLLKKLDLENLGNRQIKELSGGQKQRVACARALIKNPKMILADEPTGNLDQASSEQIFKILKTISQEKLVIIVTHDQDSAHRYADHIIQIKDGQIDGELEHKEEEKKQDLILKSAKLPLIYRFKMVKKNISSKSFKALMSIILTTFALIFVGISLSILMYDENTLIMKVMKDNHAPIYRLEKIEKTNYGSELLELEESDLQELEKIAANTVNPIYKISDNGEPLNFAWNQEDDGLYDNYIDYGFQKITEFVEIKDDSLIDHLIGNLPSSDHELVIHKYLAEYIMQIGIYDSENNLYKPVSLETIITDHRPLKMGNNTVYISGIVDDDNTLFQKNRELNKWGPYLPSYLKKDYMKKGQTVYVKGFTKIVNTSINQNDYLSKLTIHGDLFENNLYPLQKEITFIGTNIEQRTELQKDEVVLSMSLLKNIDESFEMTYKNYFLKNPINENNIITFLKEYLENHQIPINLTLAELEKNEIKDLGILKIIGISIDNCTYISNKWLEDYHPKTVTLTSVLVNEKNRDNLKRVLNKTSKGVGYENKLYTCFQMNFLNDIISQTEANRQMKPYIILICFIFILFAILLNFNLLTTSIQNSKKDIGILMALGTSKKDIIKIFLYETLIMNGISAFCSLLGFLKISNWINQSASDRLFYQTSLILINPLVITTILCFTIIISLIITAFNIKQITKITPIDAINSK